MTSVNEKDQQNEFMWEKKFHKEEKSSQNLSASMRNGKSTTYMFFAIQQIHSGKNHSMPSIDLQLQENTFVVVLWIVIKVIELEEIFFCRKYNHKDCTPQLITFIQIFIRIIFPIVLLILQDHKICVYSNYLKIGKNKMEANPTSSWLARFQRTTSSWWSVERCSKCLVSPSSKPTNT